ncbi:hypothetical protein RHGRI_015763 [Rhododendron griersonianum]|uniref:Bromo domain-containing protein n=1 Tax=Rhododendron griersonianum TaxID=479676 RepID=A0AAV6JS69_9ERIC|nr:hypothetical protein RHGRI_015763 [Rhododendron griersonianum]
MMKKKKGRPSLSNLRKRNLDQQEQEQETLIPPNPNFNTPGSRRSKPNTNNPNGISPGSDWISGDDDDDDDERKEKKVKLVVRLPSLSVNSASKSNGSDLNADGDKPQINDRSGDLSTADQVEMDEKATDILHGLPLESGPTPHLPEKKLLVFILDRLQKKDTHGVFSEPVDPNELPDYHEIIEHPMDFGTVRKKLDKGRYSNLEEFEDFTVLATMTTSFVHRNMGLGVSTLTKKTLDTDAMRNMADVFLICSNAMQYNSPNTIYFRQARSIQELAKRDFENLRQVNDDGVPQPRIVKRGRPPGKNLKKLLGNPPFDRVAPESTSDATLATVGDNATGSNSYNLRKAPTVSLRVRSNDEFLGSSHLSRNYESYSEWLSELNSEFPASVLKAEAKHGKKQTIVDENRRATYRDFHPSTFGHNQSALTTLNGNTKQLLPVGLHSEHGYARSLARFAANLGPVVWTITSKKIERALPSGEKYGPGWVGEYEALPQPRSALHEQNSLPCREDTVEAASVQDSNNESALLRSGAGEISHRLPIQTQQKHMLHSNRNGFNGVSGYSLSSQTVQANLSMPTGQSQLDELSRSKNGFSTPPMVPNHVISESKLPDSSRTAKYENISGVQAWQGFPSQHRQYSFPVQPDLNVRFQAPGSPGSSFRNDSPQQPDLVLQL